MRLKKREREKLKQLVADSILNRFTPDETLQYIEGSLGVRISLRYMEQVKAWLKRDMQQEFIQLRKDKFSYIREYLQRINELKDLQRYQHILQAKTNSEFLRHKCAVELHALTISLANLYDVLPAITERSYFSDGDILSKNNEMVSTETQPEPEQEDSPIPTSADSGPDTP